jgi:hypothetical protein
MRELKRPIVSASNMLTKQLLDRNIGEKLAPDFSKDTRSGFKATRAMARDPLVDRAREQVSQTLNGKYLDNNPFRDQAIQAALRPGAEQFQRVIAPSIAAGASRYGRSGSEASGAAFSDAAQLFARESSDTAARIGFEDYQRERQNQLAAVGMTGDIQGMQANQANALLGIGRAQEDQLRNRRMAKTTGAQMLLEAISPAAGQFGTTTTKLPKQQGGGGGGKGSFLKSLAPVIGGVAGSFFGPVGTAAGSALGAALFPPQQQQGGAGGAF